MNHDQEPRRYGQLHTLAPLQAQLNAAEAEFEQIRQQQVAHRTICPCEESAHALEFSRKVLGAVRYAQAVLKVQSQKNAEFMRRRAAENGEDLP